MAKKDDVVKIFEQIAGRFEFKKLARLDFLVPELKQIDELLGHNAETARDQVLQKANSLLSGVTETEKLAIVNLLSKSSAESIQIALQMLNYEFNNKMILIFHLDDLIVTDHDVAQIRPELIPLFSQFVTDNPNIHLVFLSHDSSDVTTILVTALVGGAAINNNQVSVVYESGLGLYLGGSKKETKDFTAGVRSEINQVMDRVAVASSLMAKDDDFRNKFYFSANEFSCGIRVHPFARGSDNSLDKEAAKKLVVCLATALADLVKEEMAAVQSHIINYYLNSNQSLSAVFAPEEDNRIWDVERVDQYLKELNFVHLGSRGSIIRPGEMTDVPAVETVVQSVEKDACIISCGDNFAIMPLMQWVSQHKNGLVCCSEGADSRIRRLVEHTGGIEYGAGDIGEMLTILHTYVNIKALIK